MIHKTNAVPCHQLVVATSSAGHVTTCLECGHVHLSLPSLTLRFDMHVFRELADMLHVAQQRFENDPVLQGAEVASAMPQAVRH